MSVVVARARRTHHELICKGAVEEVLAACTHVRTQARTRREPTATPMPTLPLDAALLRAHQAAPQAQRRTACAWWRWR